MSRIVLSTSSSGLNLLDIDHRVQFIPLHVHINGVDFVDGHNIKPQVLTNLMGYSADAVATTSPATESEITQQLLSLYDQGYREIFICCLSSQFSQSYEILQRIRQSLADKMTIYVYDTKTLNFDEAALAYEADYLLAQGKSFTEIVLALDKIRQNSRFYYTLYTLDYIIRNKKLSAPAGFFANLFDIKPILEINQTGKIVAKDKVRKIDNALAYLGKEIVNFTQGKASFIYIASGGVQEDVDYFAHILNKEFGLTNLPVIPVSTISLANHGPRGVAIGAFADEVPKIAKLFR